MRTYYIYKVTNIVNGKVYIGKTVDFKSRKWQHLRCYEKEDCEFHRAIKKYGEHCFDWEILETTQSNERASELEKSYIDKFNSFKNGYNMTKGGDGSNYWNAKPIVKLSLDGELLGRYDSAGETKKEGFWDSDVLLNCRDIKLTCKGFRFMFEDDYLEHGYRPPRQKDLPMKSIVQCDKNGNFIKEFDSVTKAANELGILRTRISSALTGISKTAGGYIFVYKKDYPIKDISIYKQNKKGRKVAQVDPKTGDIIEVFDRISEAGEKLGVNYKAIHKVVDIEDRTAYGYKWISQ